MDERKPFGIVQAVSIGLAVAGLAFGWIQAQDQLCGLRAPKPICLAGPTPKPVPLSAPDKPAQTAGETLRALDAQTASRAKDGNAKTGEAPAGPAAAAAVSVSADVGAVGQSESLAQRLARHGMHAIEASEDGIVHVRLAPRTVFLAESVEISGALEVALNRIAAEVRAWPEVQVEVIGHADAREGGARAVVDLSERRAMAAASVMLRSGLEANRIAARGVGATYPLADGEGSEGRALNRRIELRLRRIEAEEEGGAGQGTGAN